MKGFWSLFLTAFTPWFPQIGSNQAEIFRDVGDQLDKKNIKKLAQLFKAWQLTEF